jgi:hypothetical protein
MMRSLYSIGEEICFPDPAVKVIAYESKNDYKAKNHEDAIVLKVKADGQEKKVTVGSKGKIGDAKTVKIGDIDYTIFYGVKLTPFKIKLNDFIREIPWDGEKLLFF